MRTKVVESLALPSPEERPLLTWAGSKLPTSQCVGSVDLCKAMIETWGGAKSQTPTHVRNLYLDLTESARGISAVSLKDSLLEYIYGASLVINPLPSEAAHFYTSDREALLSDWVTTQSDINSVWSTSTTIQKWVDEHNDGARTASRKPEGIQTSAPATRNNTS